MPKLNVSISDWELSLLELIDGLGSSSSDRIHEAVTPKQEYLHIIRTLHGLVEKGLLERIIINKKQFYKTSRQYNVVKSFLKNSG
jgi:predicted transcriptional regulator